MTQVEWVGEAVVVSIHEAQLAEHGGLTGIRDKGALESALSRPINLAASGEPSIFDLAAASAFGIARNHPFLDGNKRTSEVVAATFLELNGFALNAEQTSIVLVWLAIADGRMSEGEIASWLRENCVAC